MASPAPYGAVPAVDVRVEVGPSTSTRCRASMGAIVSAVVTALFSAAAYAGYSGTSGLTFFNPQKLATLAARFGQAPETPALALTHQVVMGFQSRGFYNFRASVRLLQQAFPNKDLVLVGDGAGDALALVDGIRVHRGVGGWPGDKGFPKFVDFVIEGPNVHRWIDGTNACGFSVGVNAHAWLQAIAEPSGVYDDRAWCPHDAPPAVRLDTSLLNFFEKAYPESHTSYLWAPYSQFHLLGDLGSFANRRFGGNDLNGTDSRVVSGADADLGTTGVESTGNETEKLREVAWSDPYHRPFLAAYMSSDCKPHREVFFAHLRSAGASAAAAAGSSPSRPGVGEVHALGTCSRTIGDLQSPDMNVYAPFHKYRFVLTFESVEEVGYVTEKLGTALAAGAVPVYWGDSHAASLVFNPGSFIDVKRFWRENGMGDAADALVNAGEREWASLARHVLDVDNSRQAYARFLVRDARAEGNSWLAKEHDDDVVGLGLDERGSYQNPYPDSRLDPTRELHQRPRVAQAATRMRNTLQIGRRRVAYALETGQKHNGSRQGSVMRNSWRRDADGFENDRYEEKREKRLPFPCEALEARR